jgi:hypothetical protein
MAEERHLYSHNNIHPIIATRRMMTMAMVMMVVSHQWNVQFQHFKALNISTFNGDIDREVYFRIKTILGALRIEYIYTVPFT